MANTPIDPSRDPLCLALLQAASTPHGIALQVSDVRDARNTFAVRKRLLPECKGVRVLLSPFSPADEVWLMPEAPPGPADSGSSLPTVETLFPNGVL